MIIKLQNGDKIEKGLFGWISKIKDRMYRTITPRGYHIGQAAKEFIKGDTRDMSKFSPLENEVWARYLGTKYEGPSNLEPAIYRPTKGGATYNDVVKLKDESLILSDNVLKLLLDNYKKTGKKAMLVKGNESGLGTYTLSMGEDEKGKYISYYDDWDINPTRGISAKYNIPILNLIGDIVPGTHPFSVYGRRYYKKGGKMNAIEQFKQGSKIHIKKKNRGKFTAYCEGNVTSACIAKAKASGNPTLVKRATFAANARKWKHQQGGQLKLNPLGYTPWIKHQTFEEFDSTGNKLYKGSGIWDYDYLKDMGVNISKNDYLNAYKNTILMELSGGQLNVDTRSDNTRQGYHEGLPAYGAANASNTAGLWDLMNYNVVKGPVITGEPVLLPGRLSIRTVKPVKLFNPINSEAEALAAKDWLQMMGELGVFPTKAPKITNVEVKAPIHTPPVKNEFTNNLIKAIERRQDKAIPITKKVKTSVKHALSFDDMDLRHILSGRNKFTKPQRERAQYLITNHYNSSSYGPWYKNLLNSYKKEAKIDRTDKKAWTKMMKARYEIFDDFIKNSGLF